MSPPRRLVAASDHSSRVQVILDRWPRRTKAVLARNGQSIAEVILDGESPLWLEPTIRAMAELLELPENWNSYGALPIDPAAVTRALELLRGTMSADAPAPTVIPTSRGDIELEWHTRGIDLEVHPVSADRVYFFLEDHLKHTEDERELDVDLTPLAQALAELARRS